MKKHTYTHTGILFMATLMLLVSSGPLYAAETPILYLFWGDGCPHCEKEKEFLQDLRKQYPELEMRWFEVWDHPKFAKLADSLRKAYNIKTASVPMTFLGEWSTVGFRSDDTTGINIMNQLEKCLQDGCQDPLNKLGPQVIVEKIRTQAAEKSADGWESFPASSET
ncbi:hypothetical protein CSA56_09685, partial [candidate division KSB3 bacterium]